MNDELRPRLDEPRLGDCAAHLMYHPMSSSSVDSLELGALGDVFLYGKRRL
jgi:hypothetical protein